MPHDLSDPALKYIEQFLLRKIPKGGSVAIIEPKSLLGALLPRLKERVDAKFFVVGAYVPGFETVPHPDADCVIGEPTGFSEDGFLVPAQESSFWSEQVLAVAPMQKYEKGRPAECDLVAGKAVVCDRGVFAMDEIPFIASGP